MKVKVRCPNPACQSEHYLRRGTVVTSFTDGRHVKPEATGDWCECFCGTMFLALAEGSKLIRIGSQPASPLAELGKPSGELPPEDHRPRPVLPKARA